MLQRAPLLLCLFLTIACATAGPPAARNRASETLPPWAPTLGKPSARILLVEWSDFQCPACSRGTELAQQLLSAYPEDVRLAFRHFPLPQHLRAVPAAKASMAAHNQGEFFAMAERMFAHPGELTDENFLAWARELGLDLERFQADRESPEIAWRIAADLDAGEKLGIPGTPTFFINGRMFHGTFEQAKAIIDEELRRGAP